MIILKDKFDEPEIQKLYDEYNESYKKCDNFRKKCDEIMTCIEVLDRYNITEDCARKELKEKYDVYYKCYIDESQKYKDIYEQIDECRKHCEHVYEYIGHDSHHDYYRCKRCGKEERV